MTELSAEVQRTLRAVAEILHKANSVLFVTGAGVSADSGVPTYRGVGGLYNDTDTEDGVAIEQALSGPTFATNPGLTWKYLWQIGHACSGVAPNAAHEGMAAIERKKPDTWVVTQNVDGLHRAAGTENLVEVHGHMYDLYCISCGKEFVASELLDDFQTRPKLPPSCSRCTGVIRPRVVLFDEMLPTDVVEALDRLTSRVFDVVFTVGTSSIFPYISMPVAAARTRGIPTVEINPCETTISALCEHHIPLGAAAAMELILAQ